LRNKRRQPLIQQKCDDNLIAKIVSPQPQKEKGFTELNSIKIKLKKKKKKKKGRRRRRRTAYSLDGKHV
jgi:hypothetical protein